MRAAIRRSRAACGQRLSVRQDAQAARAWGRRRSRAISEEPRRAPGVAARSDRRTSTPGRSRGPARGASPRAASSATTAKAGSDQPEAGRVRRRRGMRAAIVARRASAPVKGARPRRPPSPPALPPGGQPQRLLDQQPRSGDRARVVTMPTSRPPLTTGSAGRRCSAHAPQHVLERPAAASATPRSRRDRVAAPRVPVPSAVAPSAAPARVSSPTGTPPARTGKSCWLPAIEKVHRALQRVAASSTSNLREHRGARRQAGERCARAHDGVLRRRPGRLSRPTSSEIRVVEEADHAEHQREALADERRAMRRRCTYGQRSASSVRSTRPPSIGKAGMRLNASISEIDASRAHRRARRRRSVAESAGRPGRPAPRHSTAAMATLTAGPAIATTISCAGLLGHTLRAATPAGSAAG